jgi:pilus assembly protein CpaF
MANRSQSVNDQRVDVFEQAIDLSLAPVQEHLKDPSVSEILINGHQEIFVERRGKLEKVSAQFPDEDNLRAAVNSIAQSIGRRVSEEDPRLDARLPNGSRIAVVIPPCASGTTVSIRKFTRNKISFADYIRGGAINEDGARFLDICMFLGKNILVSGGTGSGKTTLLNLLCSRIPAGQRLIVIEDTAELQIDYEHVVMFETKMADAQGKGEVSMRDLLKSSLRLRPDRIIVGEVRAAEALELINAMNTGHKGCLGTIHANSAADAIVRLESLAQGGDSKVSERAIRSQVSSAIDLIVQISRLADGSRRITEISEVRGFTSDGSYDVLPLFKMSRLIRKPDGKLEGSLEAQGELPSFMNEIVDNQLPFSSAKFLSKKVAS